MRFGWVRLSVQAMEGADAPDRLEMNGLTCASVRE
jgi:hypothetical protein